MYMLDGGPRAGQLVDDLPEGYALGDTRSAAAVVLVGDIPAARASWRDSFPRLRALRRQDG
ncbi:hypothetical protein [Microbacterium sp. SORGH_AS_0862]|uniref:hypothetical protein n=1 Tax=Microbacterium sp. SORGH_AS_0862 TaxID=3041789 RepID=UPI00278D5C98|nr:hypothetical protein [Microbacterium sp. SORGH_AS_0862]MDQ1204576.1 hypothetical protein [Microbacterium sp. SORGH_AS_0862]